MVLYEGGMVVMLVVLEVVDVGKIIVIVCLENVLGDDFLVIVMLLCDVFWCYIVGYLLLLFVFVVIVGYVDFVLVIVVIEGMFVRCDMFVDVVQLIGGCEWLLIVVSGVDEVIVCELVFKIEEGVHVLVMLFGFEKILYGYLFVVDLCIGLIVVRFDLCGVEWCDKCVCDVVVVASELFMLMIVMRELFDILFLFVFVVLFLGVIVAQLFMFELVLVVGMNFDLICCEEEFYWVVVVAVVM